MSAIRCMSRCASRRNRRIPIRSSWCTAAPCRAPITPARPTAAKAGRNISCARAMRSMSSTSPAAARSGYLAAAYGPMHNVERGNALSRFVAQEKFKLWPQAALHTQWPGSGEPDDPATMQLASSQMPAIADFASQQFLNRDALLALSTKSGRRSCSPIRRPARSAGRWPMRGPIWSRRSWRSSRTGRRSIRSSSKARPIGSSKARWRCPMASPRCRSTIRRRSRTPPS